MNITMTQSYNLKDFNKDVNSLLMNCITDGQKIIDIKLATTTVGGSPLYTAMIIMNRKDSV